MDKLSTNLVERAYSVSMGCGIVQPKPSVTMCKENVKGLVAIRDATSRGTDVGEGGAV